MKENLPIIVGKENYPDSDEEVSQATSDMKPNEFAGSGVRGRRPVSNQQEDAENNNDSVEIAENTLNAGHTPFLPLNTESPSSRVSNSDSNNVSNNTRSKSNKPGYCNIS